MLMFEWGFPSAIFRYFMTLLIRKSGTASHMNELNALFSALKKPYGSGEIVRFNLVYQRIYPALNRSDKHQAEELVDALLRDLEHEDLAPKIYGVC